MFWPTMTGSGSSVFVTIRLPIGELPKSLPESVWPDVSVIPYPALPSSDLQLP